jgi:hypothetical protein
MNAHNTIFGNNHNIIIYMEFWPFILIALTYYVQETQQLVSAMSGFKSPRYADRLRVMIGD